MQLYDSNTIGNAAPVGEWLRAMEDAFRDTALDRVEVPRRFHMERGQNSYLVMPCFGKEYFSTKTVSVFPGNLKKKQPAIYGSVILNEASTGRPLAVMDGSKLTAMRTAAVGTLGIKYLAPEEASTLGIIGLGIQGFHQALFACQQIPVKQLRVLDRNRSMMERFRERFNAYYPGVEVILSKSDIELCRGSEIVVTTTMSPYPVVTSRVKWWPGKTLIGIGSYKPEMREFPSAIFSDLQQVFVDSIPGIEEAGDLVVPLGKQVIRKDQILQLSDLILGKEIPVGDTRFFKSVGMAAFDLYGAILVYESLS